LRGLVEAVIGAPDALHDPARALGRADIDDEIDVPPVDPQIERRGADDGAQPPLQHRRLDLAALLDIERAVMQGDGEPVLVDVPQAWRRRSSACMRVLTKTSVVLCALISS
jgi:hypothetical protein